MFRAVIVAFEVLPHIIYDLLAQNELGGLALVGLAVAIMQRTRGCISSPDFFGLGTCSIVLRLFWNGCESRPKTNIRERIEY